MIVKSEQKDKMCSFYVSDFHLEMILVPFLNKKIDNNEDIKIVTEKDLKDSVEILISKMNLNEDKKQKILNLEWNRTENLEFKNNSNIIIIGREQYINETNNKIKQLNIREANIVDCYDFEEIKDKMENITENYEKNLNTLGNDIF